MYQSFAKLHLNQLITTTECISRNNCDGRIDDLVVAEFPICPALCRENVGLYCHRSKHVIKNNPPASHTPPRIGAITIDDIQKQEWLESTETRSSGLPKNVKECQPSVRRHLRFTSRALHPSCTRHPIPTRTPSGISNYIARRVLAA